MQLKNIITERKYQFHFAMQIVYEWEEVISRQLGLEFIYESYWGGLLNKLLKKLHYPASPRFLFKENSLKVELVAKCESDVYNHPKIVPWIIDFYLTEKDLSSFETAHKNNPFLLVSSKEADDFLTQHNFPIKHYHLPLSIPDKYKPGSCADVPKDIDLVLMGRPNPVLEQWLHTYAAKYPDFSYILRKNHDGKLAYFDNRGSHMEFPDSREEYFRLLRRAKISFYSTPGIDGGEIFTHGFNQVTPRLLEILVCGCHVIARWKDTPDSDYYKLSTLCKNVQTYSDFERLINLYRNEPVEFRNYQAYLEEHYTSVVAAKLEQILKQV